MLTNSPQIIINFFCLFVSALALFLASPYAKNGFSIFFLSEAFFYYLSFTTTSKSVFFSCLSWLNHPCPSVLSVVRVLSCLSWLHHHSCLSWLKTPLVINYKASVFAVSRHILRPFPLLVAISTTCRNEMPGKNRNYFHAANYRITFVMSKASNSFIGYDI